LCGMLDGAVHWTETSGDGEQAQQRRRERQIRVAQLNRVLAGFACRVSDWQGHAYLLSTLTGKTEIIDSLAQLWSTVERLSGRRADPLDADLLVRLRQTP